MLIYICSLTSLFMKKFLALLSVAGLLLAQGVSAFAFGDVTQDDFYYNSVTFLADEGIVTGYPDGSFGYDLTINRAELLTIVVKAAGVSLDSAQWIAYSNEDCFADTGAGQWYTQYVCYAKAQGWVGGYADDTFKPAQPVNFVEALKITMNALGIDSDSGTSPWYKGIVDAASEKNLIPLTVHAFDQEITRGEMSDLIARILKYNSGELDAWLGDLSGAVLTYDLIVNKGFWTKYSFDVDEPGISMDLDGYYLGISNCGGKTCFDEEFLSCAPKGSFLLSYFSPTLSYRYEIIGEDGDKCSMKSFYPSNPNPEWENKEMTCKYDNSKSFDEAVKEWDGCKGELWDLINAPTE